MLWIFKSILAACFVKTQTEPPFILKLWFANLLASITTLQMYVLLPDEVAIVIYHLHTWIK